MQKIRILVVTIPCLLLLAGCVTVLKTLNLATFNEVLLAVKANDANRVREAARERVVFEEGDKAIDSTNVCGESPLHLAIQNGNLEITQILLQEGANPNLPTEAPREPSLCTDTEILGVVPGLTPMHYAIIRNKPAIAEALLFAGADSRLKTADGKTAIALADDKEGFEVLLAYLESPANLAARIGDIGALQAAVQQGDDLNVRMPVLKTTPLEDALLARSFYAVEFLTENGGAMQVINDPESLEALSEYFEEYSDSPSAAVLRQLTGTN